jgi:hypothetical protein
MDSTMIALLAAMAVLIVLYLMRRRSRLGKED